MFLTHGINESGVLVAVAEVESGRTTLRCPFCAELLIARKGVIKEHHFAHDGETCADSQRTLQLTGIPLYDTATGFSSTEKTVFYKVAQYRNIQSYWITTKQTPALEALISAGLITQKERQKLDLTQLGVDIYYYLEGIRSSRSILPDAAMQERLFSVRHKMLSFLDACNGTQATRYFQLRLQTIIAQHLYLLAINFQQGDRCIPLIKVGLTTRADVQLRVSEIRRDLNKYGTVLSIEVLGVYSQYGSLEKLVHKKLQKHKFEMGKHQEYFYALDSADSLKYLELNKLGKRQLKGEDIQVTYRDHAHKIRAGQNRQKLLHGKHLGRPAKDSVTLAGDHPDIEKAFRQSLSLRKASETTGKAINTVRRVYAALKEIDNIR